MSISFAFDMTTYYALIVALCIVKINQKYKII